MYYQNQEWQHIQSTTSRITQNIWNMKNVSIELLRREFDLHIITYLSNNSPISWKDISYEFCKKVELFKLKIEYQTTIVQKWFFIKRILTTKKLKALSWYVCLSTWQSKSKKQHLSSSIKLYLFTLHWLLSKKVQITSSGNKSSNHTTKHHYNVNYLTSNWTS